ncbi:MAG: heavy-metal-associated domain-containing protein [Patescibacteria group bacterium]
MTTITLNIRGMHCTSCAMNIDDALEDVPGVVSSRTNYARAQTTIEMEPASAVTPEQLIAAIEAVGYQATRILSE